MRPEEVKHKVNVWGDKLVFSTNSFSAGGGSILHGGIYNRELSSSLLAGAVTLLLIFGMNIYGIKLRLLHIASSVAVFAGLFIAFRWTVFKESFLKVVIDKSGGKIDISKNGLLGNKMSFPLGDVVGISKGVSIIAPQNQDGIKVVEKIALQHGQVIPGFGEVQKFHTLNLELKDGMNFMIFSSPDSAQTEYIAKKMKVFLGGRIAQKD